MVSKIWMVYRQGSNGTYVVHPSYENALAEAKRLAKLSSGNYFVMESVAEVESRQVVEVKDSRPTAQVNPSYPWGLTVTERLMLLANPPEKIKCIKSVKDRLGMSLTDTLSYVRQAPEWKAASGR